MDPELGTPVLNGMRMYSWQKLGALILLAAVKYRNQWFYIDATDHLSKRTFSTVQILFEILAPAGGGATPLLSLPTG